MKKSLFSLPLYFLILSLLVVGCKRSTSDVVEDTRTAGNYMGKSLRSLAGNRGESRQFEHPNEFNGPHQDQYIPLNDEDLSMQNQDAEAAMGDRSYPQSNESPGEAGSTLPSIEGFKDPIEM